jgi:hypothetical protein
MAPSGMARSLQSILSNEMQLISITKQQESIKYTSKVVTITQKQYTKAQVDHQNLYSSSRRRKQAIGNANANEMNAR